MAGTLMVSVVNPTTLQVKAYVSENDLAEIFEGATVVIDTNARGIVEAVAPAVDSQTKKAQVNIIITDNGNPPIVVGQSVSVKVVAKNTNNTKYFLLPIEAIQFMGNETYVLTVDDNSVLQKIPVVTGQVVGEKIYVTSGLDESIPIVASVRGLMPGQMVKIRK